MKWNKKNNRFSLKAKLLLITSLITIVAIVVVSAIFYSDLYNQTKHLLQQQALGVAKSAAMLIDGDAFERISLTLDAKDPYYEESLNALKKLNKDIGQGMLYTIVNQEPDYYTYVVDGSGTVTIGHKQKKIDFAKEAAWALKNGKSYFCEPYYIGTFNKYYISAFVPIFNSQDEVVGIMEYDYEGAEIIVAITKMTTHIFKATILLISCALIINYFLLKRLFRPIEKLVEAINVIAEGDLTVELACSHSNEIGKINSALNKTVHNMRCILEKIKETSNKVTIASKSILVSSKDTTEGYEELAVSTVKLLETTQKQVDVSRKVTATLEELQQDIQIICQRVTTEKNEFNRICETATRGFKAIEEAELQISHVESRLTMASQISSHIDNHMNKIQDMIMSVLRISEQATLLALTVREEKSKKQQETSDPVLKNIEALIKQSHLATKEIEGIIHFINEQIGTVAYELKESSKDIEVGLKATTQSKKFLMTICDDNKALSRNAYEMDTAINDILDTACNIKESVQNIEEVSTSIDTSTMSLLAITEEQVATSDEFKNMAKLLREQAKLLDDSISRFKV